MTLPTQTPQQMIDSMVASFAASTGIPPVFTSGDALLAFFQTLQVQIEFLQGLISQLVLLTRAQTSTGADLDSWMAQFAFPRLPPTYGDGDVTFGATQPAVNPVSIQAATLVNGVYQGGAVIQTSNGGIQYQVVPDTNNAAYSAATNSYVLAVGQTSVTALVQALTAGSASNVAANALIVIASPLPGINTVTNPAPITNGVDAETDAAFRARFVLYLGTLAKATKSAIVAAAAGVQQGLLINPVENENPQGVTVSGSFTVFVDDGSGDPPTSLIDNVFTAIDAVRAFGVQAFAAGPNVTTATIGLLIRVAENFVTATVIAAVQNSIAASTNQLVAGETLYVSAIIEAALSVPGCAAVNAPTVTINGTAADFTPSAAFEIRTSVPNIAVGTY
ncbi:MAG TPA: baseplate J/gp47 family protein [Acetobacteraceae bacterium]|jgi:uncharacterized phage protein gp47/JayE|nr:baseplate J/gp47 family protein [Acetobacteraceae bacterium]